MRGFRAFFVKDLRLLSRNHALLIVLLLYPVLAAGLLGAAFSRTGRPVPVGVVNLDRPTEEVLWFGGRVEDHSAAVEVFRQSVGSPTRLGGEEQARKALEEGLVNAAIGPRAGDGWWGGVLDADRSGVFLKEIKRVLSPALSLEGPEEADEALGREDAFLLAVKGDSLPFLGEGFWYEGRNLDAAALAETFAGGACELRHLGNIREAKQWLSSGRVDAAVVLPPGLVHSLKLMDDTASLRILVDRSNLLKAQFAEAGVRDMLSRLSEEAVRQKMKAVVSGLQVLIRGGDFFGTEVTGLAELREDLEKVRRAVRDRPELASALDRSLGLADAVMRDLDVAADYLQGTALPVQLQVNTISGRPLSAKDAAIPSLVVLSLLWTGLLCGAALMAWEREEGMLERVSMTGISSRVPVYSKTALSGAVVFLLAVVLFLLSSFILGTPWDQVGLAVGVLLIGSLSISALGSVVGTAVEEVPAAMMAGAMISFVLLFLCGAVYPLEQMPTFLRWLAWLFPPTHVQQVLSRAMLQGKGWSDSWPSLLAMVILGISFASAASRLWSRAGRG